MPAGEKAAFRSPSRGENTVGGLARLEYWIVSGSGLPESAKPFDFIGYRELRAAVRGEMQLEEARAAIEQATRRYAKRQLTWFRGDPQVHWLSGFGNDPTIQQQTLALYQKHL